MAALRLPGAARAAARGGHRQLPDAAAACRLQRQGTRGLPRSPPCGRVLAPAAGPGEAAWRGHPWPAADDATEPSRASAASTSLAVLAAAGLCVAAASGAGGAVSCDDGALREGGSAVPKFDPRRPYHDPSTYGGRVKNALGLIDARLLLVTDEELQRSQRLLRDYDRSALEASASDADLWHARRIVDGIIHPVTGEKILIVGRMSAFVLVNLPVAAGMLIHGPTSPLAAVFWQWVNQSVNVACNYANRSGAAVDWSGIAQSYALATSVSCGLALGSGVLMRRRPGLRRLGVLVPYFAVICASTANMFFSRMQEWTEGVPVFDAEGVERGMSARAGLEGVVRTVTTRSWIVPMPLLILPPMLMQVLRITPAIAGSAGLLLASELACIAVCLQCALPLVLALQPATMTLAASSLEPRFHGLKDSGGNDVEYLFANKGL